MQFIHGFSVRLKSLPQERIAFFVFLSSFFVSAYFIADLTWKLWPLQQTSFYWQPQRLPSDDHETIDLQSLLATSMFGVAKEVETELVKSDSGVAPQTTLPIKLTGVVVASENQAKSLAIIDASGRQNTYIIGDMIQGTSASLHQVKIDRVIISLQGRYETLMLEGAEYRQQESNSSVGTTSVNSRLQKKRQELLRNPQSVIDLISISPVKRQGKLLGYRINPKRDRQLFLDAGFRPNDLAKSINGYDLTDRAASIELMGQLRTLKQISVVVERDGQLTEVTLDLNQN